jgi:aromatic ring-opening dioxygenase LigB subunit
MPLVFGCIVPHGDEIVPELAGNDLKLFGPTRKGIRKVSAIMRRSRPDTIVIATPHNLRLMGHIAVCTSENSSGRWKIGKGEIRLRAKCNVKLAEKLVRASVARGIPAVAANYGTAEGELSDLPMDWGSMIPLWFFLKEAKMRSRIVIVSPSREIPLDKNFEFGKVVAETSLSSPERIAFVASADQAHRHRKDGPYGYSPRSKEYDSKVLKAIRSNDLRSIMSYPESLVASARPDSLWQMTMLAGVAEKVPMKSELISYQVPTYYGMLCASFELD